MSKKNSPFKILGALVANPALAGAAISGAGSLLGGVFGAVGAGKAKRVAERKERKAREEMDRMKKIYSELDTSNPYANMENTMEDLTINQKQAQFQAQQFQQSQANILSNMRHAAGSSGVEGVAQALAQQGQLASQRSAASIGAQESRNQTLKQQEASRLQTLERRGDIMSRDMERNKVTTLLGMAQQETAAYGQAAAQAQQAKYDAIGGAFQGIAAAGVAGLEAGAFDGMGGGLQTPTPTDSTPTPSNTTNNQYGSFDEAFSTNRQNMISQFGMDHSKWKPFDWAGDKTGGEVRSFHPYQQGEYNY